MCVCVGCVCVRGGARRAGVRRAEARRSYRLVEVGEGEGGAPLRFAAVENHFVGGRAGRRVSATPPKKQDRILYAEAREGFVVVSVASDSHSPFPVLLLGRVPPARPQCFDSRRRQPLAEADRPPHRRVQTEGRPLHRHALPRRGLRCQEGTRAAVQAHAPKLHRQRRPVEIN